MNRTLGLFEAYGVELEYMIVNRADLSVLPVADRVLTEDGVIASDHEDGPITWSNELALHVIELKTTAPAPSLSGLGASFHESARRILTRLAPEGACILPSAMHPWMDPEREFRKWPHDNAEIYAAFDRIFDCRGHGWSNLQSVHLNLPFADAEEFGRLHAAIRLVLPLIPALAASSPFCEGRRALDLDARLRFYQHNARRIPAVAGRVIPEPIFDPEAYQAELLQPLYRAIAPFDAEGILQHEWLNARGAIARFDRNTIEIRVTDSQECPKADLAVTELIAELVRGLVEERWSSYAAQRRWPVEPLAQLFDLGVRAADDARFEDPAYLEVLGLDPAVPLRGHELWRLLFERLQARLDPDTREHLGVYAQHGTLARRLVRGAGDAPPPERLRAVYGELVRCFETNRSYTP